MLYPYITTVEWEPRGLTPQQAQLIEAKIVQLKSENKTDGVLLKSDTPNVSLSSRHWASQEDAQAWLDWLETLPGITVGNTNISEV